MPKSSKSRRRYKKGTKGGCGCQLQKGGYSLRKLSIRKSPRKSPRKSLRKKPIIMKGGLGGVPNTSLDFGTVGGAATTAGVLGGTPLYSGGDPNISASSTVSGYNTHSLPMV